MFNFHHLHYFWAVAHDGNLTRAALRLHVSQSAVSMQIQKLEAELGHALFERRGKQLLLTEAGRIALDHADAIFARGDELESALQERGKQRTCCAWARWRRSQGTFSSASSGLSSGPATWRLSSVRVRSPRCFGLSRRI